MLGKNKSKSKIREKKNLLVANMGDIVVIKNRSIIGSAILGATITAFFTVIFFLLKEAWDQPVFWLIFLFLFASNIFSLVKTLVGRIVLDSKNTSMTVYGPFKKEYKFENINYVDLKSSRPNEGYITHSVLVYIGEGKKCVKIDTMSRPQADELVSLLRGMLDNAAMEYPEGNEEPFDLDDKKENEKKSLWKLLKSKKEKTEVKESSAESKEDESKSAEGEPAYEEDEKTAAVSQSEKSESGEA